MKNSIIAYAGTTPVLDGTITLADKWDEAQETRGNCPGGYISIKAKHNGVNIYFLFTSNIPYYSTWQILFEDDDGEPDGILDGINADRKYLYNDDFVDSNIRLGMWTTTGDDGSNNDGGYAESINGTYYYSEWWLPLSTGTLEDINVTSNETLMFCTIGSGYSGWPSADKVDAYEPQTWGFLHILFSPRIFDSIAPTANAGGNCDAQLNGSHFFNSNLSLDNTGILYCTWFFQYQNYNYYYEEQVIINITLFGFTPEFTFDRRGIVNVSLTVLDCGGNIDIDYFKVNVIDLEPPIADAGGDVIAYPNETVSFNGEYSYDNNDVANYTWHVYEGNLTTISQNISLNYVFQKPGFYDVILNVTDIDDNWDTDAIIVWVLNANIDNYYVVNRSMTTVRDLKGLDHATYYFPMGLRDVNVQITITYGGNVDFYIFGSESELDIYENEHTRWFVAEQSVENTTTFTTVLANSHNYYLVLDNEYYSVEGAMPTGVVSYEIQVNSISGSTAQDTSNNHTSEEYGIIAWIQNNICASMCSIIILMAIVTTYWLLSRPSVVFIAKKDPPSEDNKGEV
ncbi:MAG: PKD domain-containing protein [Methanobacteriota archaeon]